MHWLVILLAGVALFANEPSQKCYDIGGISGSNIYESHKAQKKSTYRCKKPITKCQELDSQSCEVVKPQSLKMLQYVEIRAGFLTTQSCLEEGLFQDCPLVHYHNNRQPLLLIDSKGKAHPLDLSSIKPSVIDPLILKRNITVQGHYVESTELIKVDKIFQQIVKPKLFMPQGVQ